MAEENDTRQPSPEAVDLHPPCSLPSLSKAWVEELERAALQEKSLRAVWERHYKNKMSYDEFHMRRHLTLAVQRNEMDETYARELIAKHKANSTDHPTN